MGNVQMEVNCSPEPVFEYKAFRFMVGSGIVDGFDEKLSAWGAEGWDVAGVLLNGQVVLLRRKVGIRLIPVEEPQVIGASNQLRLARAGPGNGR